jgi:hypothetical protein
MILFAEVEIVFAISRLASILRSVMNAGLLEIASPISWALLASPYSTKENTRSARIILPCP